MNEIKKFIDWQRTNKFQIGFVAAIYLLFAIYVLYFIKMQIEINIVL